jgi:hypothetical protein
MKTSELVARALCRASGQPEDEIVTSATLPKWGTPVGMAAAVGVSMALWKCYEPQALALLADKAFCQTVTIQLSPEIITLSGQDHAALTDAIANPPEPSAALRELMRRPALATPATPVMWTTDTEDFAYAIKEFEAALPGFWWSVGQCSVGAHASCAVDGNGVQADLLRGVKSGNPLDAAFDCDTVGGSPAEALRDVMQQAIAHLKDPDL